MDYRINTTSLEGQHLVQVTEDVAATFGTGVAASDLSGEFPIDRLHALRDARYLYSPFPVAAGGFGVPNYHDVVVASSRLAEVDPSLTIGANMHLIGALGLARIRNSAIAAGQDAKEAAAFAAMAEQAGTGQIYSAAVSEPDQDLSQPATRATRAEGGWEISGFKIFCTMSPGATHLNVAVTVPGDDGVDRYAFAQVPTNAPGVRVNGDWDALGMRSSGSGTVSLDQVRIPATAMGKGFVAGEMNAHLFENFLASGPMHAAASLGIAESAWKQVVLAATPRAGRVGHGRPLRERPTAQIQAAELQVELIAARATLERAANIVDGYYAANPTGRGELADVQVALAGVQAAKAFVNGAAMRIVDRAMSIVGGGGFMSKHPLSRMYRDVRAGPFMHPLGANVAYEFIGQVALGADVSLK